MDFRLNNQKDPTSKQAVVYAGVTTCVIVVIWLILTQTTLREEKTKSDITWKDSFQALGSDVGDAIEENSLPSFSERPKLSEINDLLNSETEQEHGTGTTSEQ
jgi:hypothetical protein